MRGMTAAFRSWFRDQGRARWQIPARTGTLRAPVFKTRCGKGASMSTGHQLHFVTGELKAESGNITNGCLVLPVIFKL
jgi:hypothetical protein